MSAALWHAVACPIRRRWRRRRLNQPFWRDDPVAKMLGVAAYGCPRCGRGAIEERDAAAAHGGVPCDDDHENPRSR